MYVDDGAVDHFPAAFDALLAPTKAGNAAFGFAIQLCLAGFALVSPRRSVSLVCREFAAFVLTFVGAFPVLMNGVDMARYLR